MSPLFSSRSLLLILVALRAREVLGQCQEGVECPAPDSPPENRPDPEDCSSYFLCVGGCAIHQKCQDNFLFDLAENYCNYPELVDCGDRPCEDAEHCTATTVTTTTTTSVPDTSTTSECSSSFPPGQTCPGATVNFPDMYDCTSYYHCENRCASHMQCGVGELFDLASRDCKPSETVKCGHRHCTDPQHCPCINYDDLLEEECPEHTEDGEILFPDMRECARYLNCTAGCFTSVLCSNDYLYNDIHKWCSHPPEITCGFRPCSEDPSRCHCKDC